MMKKALICITAFLAVALGGCSKGHGSSGSVSSEPSSQDTSSVSSDISSEEGKRYTVRWENFDGALLEEDKNVEEGSMPTYDGEEPSKPDDEGYSFLFKGWTPAIAPVKKDITYTAIYESDVKTFSIKWVNHDGALLESDVAPYGANPTYEGVTPTKDATTEYTYRFAGWDPMPTTVIKDATYTATFMEVKKEPSSLVLDGGKNKLFEETGNTSYSGTATLITEEGTSIDFVYVNMRGLPAHYYAWQQLTADGAFYNVSPIHGIASITINNQSSGVNYKFTYASDPEFKYNVKTMTYESTANVPNLIDLSDELPNYFKIEGTNNPIDIASVNISYLNADHYYSLITANEDSGRGTVSGDYGDYAVGETVKVIATPKTDSGYCFVGWKEGEEIVSTSPIYEFAMPNRNVNLVAVFGINETSSLTLLVNDESKGTVIGEGAYKVGETVTMQAYPKPHCQFLYWLDGNGQFYSRADKRTFQMPTYYLTFTAVFAYQDYKVSLSSEDPFKGSAHFENEEGVHEKPIAYLDTFTAVAKAKNGYTFAGWYENEELVSVDNPYTGTVEGDVSLVAKWSVNKYHLNVTSDDESKLIAVGGGDYEYGEEVHLVAMIVDDHCQFDGWYEGGKLISGSLEFDIVMTPHNRTIEARWEYKSYRVTITLGSAGVYPEINGAGTYVYGTEITLKCSIANQDRYSVSWGLGNELISRKWSFQYTVTGNLDFVVRVIGFPD